MPLIKSHTEQGIVMILFLTDRLSPKSSRRVFKEIDDFMNPGAKLALDLGSVVCFDAAVMSLLVRCIRRAADTESSVRIFNLRESARIVAEMARLNQIVDIYNSQDEVFRAFGEEEEVKPAAVAAGRRDHLLAGAGGAVA
jgi:anti-anti-sigma regulatory factor